MSEVEAQFYEKRENNRVKCFLCPHHCSLQEGQEGLCRVRVNRGGSLYSLNYGDIAAVALDPIEKKPLFHFYPGKLILSIGTYGCNLACSFCQNFSLAHEKPDISNLDIKSLLEIAWRVKSKGSIGVAFTYNEPSIWYEFIRETAPMLKEQGQKIVLVSNGYIESQPLRELLPWVDAMNIDVKAFSDDFYRHHCRGRLKAVLKTVEMAAAVTHVEVTNLIIPEENDNIKEIKKLVSWLAAIDPGLPLHFSRYYPAYNFNKAATPAYSLKLAQELAKEYLNFVYLGNIPGEECNTCCLECGEVMVKRNTYDVKVVGLKDGRCQHCGSKVDYILT
jgi:pyruvate formate lyase activating enzyme